MTTIPVLRGLHHVTAITGNAPANLDFYTRILGMRLVKKTVNQDDVSAYHLFYADAIGSPGTDLTFFDWKQMPQGLPGAGTVSETAFRIQGGTDSLNLWLRWFEAQGVSHGPMANTGQFPSIPFQDPEGQRLRLIAEPAGADFNHFHPWRGSPVPLEAAIVGLGAVTLTVRDFEPAARFLTEILQFRVNSNDPGLFELGEGGLGARLHLHTSSSPGTAMAGGVHHVAWAVANLDQQHAWLGRLAEYQVATSGLIDRFYFQSVYFRIPGGILFEIATEGPGFTADGEEMDRLGEELSLPPFLEKRRVEIEAGLEPLESPKVS